jgi:hypothetical protein
MIIVLNTDGLACVRQVVLRVDRWSQAMLPVSVLGVLRIDCCSLFCCLVMVGLYRGDPKLSPF